MTSVDRDREIEFIISKIEKVDTVRLDDGSVGLSVRGHFFSPVEEIAFLRFGIPNYGLFMAERYPVEDICQKWPDAPDAKVAGFKVNIPLNQSIPPAVSLRLVATFADGFEVVGSFLVALDAAERESQSCSSVPSLSAETPALLYLPECCVSDYLNGAAPRATLLTQIFSTLGISVVWGARLRPDFQRDTVSQIAPGLEVVWGLVDQELLLFLEKEISRFDYIWVTDPGWLKLLAALRCMLSHGPRLIFDASIEMLSTAVALDLEKRRLFGEGVSEDKVMIACSEWRNTPLVEQQLFELVTIADAAVVKSSELFSSLAQRKCPNLSLLPDVQADFECELYDRYFKRVEQLLHGGNKVAVRSGRQSVTQHGLSLRQKIEQDISRQGEKQDLLALLKEFEAWPRYSRGQAAGECVDVIIPVFNALAQVKRCIESVLGNSDVRFNLIVVNDASTDPAVSEYLAEIRKRSKVKYLEQVSVIESSRNSGFAASINAGLMVSHNDVVLLNSDTQVPEGWLSRLIQPWSSDPNIGSITPFSNAATICTLPVEMGEDQSEVRELHRSIDQALLQLAPAKAVEIPTAVGFCMAISRKALNEVGFFDDRLFCRMYGEENDWSMRARAAGYKNVLLPFLYVYHEDRASVSELKSAEREPQLALSARKNELLYPEYPQLLKSFYESAADNGALNPLFFTVVQDRVSKCPGILIINNRFLGGGSQLFLQRYIDRLKTQGCRAYILQVDQAGVEFVIYREKSAQSYLMEWGDLDQANFNRIIKSFKIDNIFVNQFFHSNHSLLMSLIANCGVAYDYMVHDYYAACPTVNLISGDGQYCHAQTNSHECMICLARAYQQNDKKRVPVVNIAEWRNQFGAFLGTARNVLVPSEHARRIVQTYYPAVNSRLFVYTRSETLKMTYRPEFADGEPLVVGIIGAVGEHKGEAFVYRLYAAICEEKLPVMVKVLGYTSAHNQPFISEDGKIEITGHYANDQVSELLANYSVGLVLDLSIWPETYCFTVDEALFSGYPVMSFGIGAAAERIEWLNGGWILPEVGMDVLVAKLKQLVSERNLLRERAFELQRRVGQVKRVANVRGDPARKGKKGQTTVASNREHRCNIPYWI